MNNFSALLITIISGLFFGIGFLFVRFFKKKKELSIIATSLAFIVMLGMICFDLFPEILELLEEINHPNSLKIGYVGILIALGIIILKIFDTFLPAHHHEHHENEKSKKEHNHHMFHVGFILAFSLLLHNILEGISMYIIATENLSAGILMAVGVGLHNLPLGIEIATNLENENEKKKITIFMLFFLIFSAFLGALFLFLFQVNISSFFLLLFLSISCGMILYIAFFELLKEILTYKNSKYTYIGIGIGIIFLTIMTFFE